MTKQIVYLCVQLVRARLFGAKYVCFVSVWVDGLLGSGNVTQRFNFALFQLNCEGGPVEETFCRGC